MGTHNIHFCGEVEQIIPESSSISPPLQLLWILIISKLHVASSHHKINYIVMYNKLLMAAADTMPITSVRYSQLLK